MSDIRPLKRPSGLLVSTSNHESGQRKTSQHPRETISRRTMAILCALALSGCFSEAPDSTGPGDGGDTAVTVDMTPQLTFVQRSVTINAGETVRWTNSSNVPHTVTADPTLARDPTIVRLPSGATAFNSGDIQPGADYFRKFDVPGRYDYFCIPHETNGMIGTVIVNP